MSSSDSSESATNYTSILLFVWATIVNDSVFSFHPVGLMILSLKLYSYSSPTDSDDSIMNFSSKSHANDSKSPKNGNRISDLTCPSREIFNIEPLLSVYIVLSFSL